MKAVGLTITGLTRTLFMSRTDAEAAFTSATQEVRQKVKVKEILSDTVKTFSITFENNKHSRGYMYYV